MLGHFQQKLPTVMSNKRSKFEKRRKESRPFWLTSSQELRCLIICFSTVQLYDLSYIYLQVILYQSKNSSKCPGFQLFPVELTPLGQTALIVTFLIPHNLQIYWLGPGPLSVHVFTSQSASHICLFQITERLRTLSLIDRCVYIREYYRKKNYKSNRVLFPSFLSFIWTVRGLE